ncbi:localization factor PodJL [mine drainage metagenome]|uniref:Localization factor PodJL n=1 Tax=mine drainage metagenome TaxID=410659 RepID=A0A1J5RIB1_9ZZZZ
MKDFVSPGASKAALLSLLLLALICSGARADVAGGIAAYHRGDYPAALSEFRIAADQDDPFAQNLLGLMYVQGLGVQRNYQLALDWFSRAQVLGLPDAMANLAKMYADGLGVTKNDATARRYYRDAALTGFRPALLLMVKIYEKGGLGVAPDAEKALFWRARLRRAMGKSDQVHSEAAQAPAPLAASVVRAAKAAALPKTARQGKPVRPAAENQASFEQRVFRQLERYQRRERKLFVGSDDGTPALGAYLQNLRTRLQHLLATAFPASKPAATMMLSYSILRDGTLRGVELSHSSGNPNLDRKVLALSKTLTGLPPLPAAVSADVLMVTVGLPIE